MANFKPNENYKFFLNKLFPLLIQILNDFLLNFDKLAIEIKSLTFDFFSLNINDINFETNFCPLANLSLNYLKNEYEEIGNKAIKIFIEGMKCSNEMNKIYSFYSTFNFLCDQYDNIQQIITENFQYKKENGPLKTKNSLAIIVELIFYCIYFLQYLNHIISNFHKSMNNQNNNQNINNNFFIQNLIIKEKIPILEQKMKDLKEKILNKMLKIIKDSNFNVPEKLTNTQAIFFEDFLTLILKSIKYLINYSKFDKKNDLNQNSEIIIDNLKYVLIHTEIRDNRKEFYEIFITLKKDPFYENKFFEDRQFFNDINNYMHVGNNYSDIILNENYKFLLNFQEICYAKFEINEQLIYIKNLISLINNFKLNLENKHKIFEQLNKYLNNLKEINTIQTKQSLLNLYDFLFFI